MNEHKNLRAPAGAPTRRQVIGLGAFTLAALAVGSDRAWTQQSMPEARSQTASKGGSSMGSISVACYKPKPGCEQALLELVRNHLPPLRAQGLVTERAPIVMRTADGTIVEIFEWVSQEAIAGAHKNPAVLDLWKRFEVLCSYETPSNIAEFHNMFAHFEPL
jgi:hypothetical protein